MIYEINDGSMQRVDVFANSAVNNLPIGTVLRFNGYGDYDLAIIRNEGVKGSFSSYGTTYSCIRLDNYQESKHQAFSLKHISQKQDNRIAVYYTDRVLDAGEVAELVEKSKQADIIREKAKREKDEHISAVKAGLPAKYPYLTLEKDSAKKGATLAAMNIRKELKQAFPTVKFSVTSEYYSGGCSVDVRWTDGPTTEKVEAITGKYQEGSFDGMTDSYNYEQNLFADLFGGARHVMEQRTSSEQAYNDTARSLGYDCLFNPRSGQFDGVPYDVNEMIKRATWAR